MAKDDGLFQNKEHREELMASAYAGNLDQRTYNIIIGGLLLYGLVLNAIMCAACHAFFFEFMAEHCIVFIIGYFVMAFAGIALANMDDPLTQFIGYNVLAIPVGAILAVSVPEYPTELILQAIIDTAIVVLGMLILATLYPGVFERMWSALTAALFIGIIVELITVFWFGYDGELLDIAFVFLFSLYVACDWQRAQSFPYTVGNAIFATVDMYLDIVNLFIRILSILAKSRSKD